MNAVFAPRGPATAEFFAARTCPEPNSGCLLWTGAFDRVGYGLARVGRRTVVAHRLGFFLEYDRWPKDKLLHTCDVRACVNLAHLYEGSQADNMRDRVVRGRDPNANKTICKNGHPMIPENLYVYPGKHGPHRHCKPCIYERKAAQCAKY